MPACDGLVRARNIFGIERQVLKESGEAGKLRKNGIAGKEKSPAEHPRGSGITWGGFRRTPGIGGSDGAYISRGNPKISSQTVAICPIIAFLAHSASRFLIHRNISL
jgi:hypothetical protein